MDLYVFNHNILMYKICRRFIVTINIIANQIPLSIGPLLPPNQFCHIQDTSTFNVPSSEDA